MNIIYVYTGIAVVTVFTIGFIFGKTYGTNKERDFWLGVYDILESRYGKENVERIL